MMAGIVFIIVLISSSLAFVISSDMKQVVTSDLAGQITSGSLFDMSLNISDGRFVRYELTVTGNQTVDVYLMGDNEFYLMRNNQSFNYITASSGVSHVKTETALEGNQTYFVLVSIASSNDPSDTGVPVSWTAQQSHFPLVFHDVFSILTLPFIALTILSLYYLLKAYAGFADHRT